MIKVVYTWRNSPNDDDTLLSELVYGKVYDAWEISENTYQIAVGDGLLDTHIYQKFRFKTLEHHRQEKLNQLIK